METETMFGTWTIIDGIDGSSVYPENISIMEAIEDYGFDGICSIAVDHGWCARLSMSGYLDCTDWLGPFDHEYQADKACELMLRIEE